MPRTRLSVSLAGAALAAACATFAFTPEPRAQAAQDGITVLVLAEDEDTRTVKRNSNAFRRLLARFSETMADRGIRVIGEEALVEATGESLGERPRKRALLKAGARMAEADGNDAEMQAIVLLTMRAALYDRGTASEFRTRIDGEIFDIGSRDALGSFEIPENTLAAPEDCVKTVMSCFNDVVGAGAEGMALTLGDTVAAKLDDVVPAGGRQTGR